MLALRQDESTCRTVGAVLELPRKYTAMVAKSWGRAISGPILAVVGLILLVLQLSMSNTTQAALALKVGAGVTLAIAAVLVFVAHYEVWRTEREKRINVEQELEQRKSRADIRGRIHEVYWETPTPSFDSLVMIHASLRNESPEVSPTIREFIC